MEMQGIGAGTTPADCSIGTTSELLVLFSLESVEAQLVVRQKNEAVYEENIAVLEFEVKDKNNVVTRLKNHQLSSKDKIGLGYVDQLNENDSSGSELFDSVFDSRSSDGDDNQTNDRFKKDNGYHVVPPPLTGNYMPPLADQSFAGLDDFVYRPTTNKTSASVSQVKKSTSQISNTNVEMPRVESVRPSEVIIEDWVSDDDEDIFQSNDLQATDKPSFKRIEFTNSRNEFVKPKQAKKPRIITQNPKVDRRDWNGKMTQKLGLGFGFTKKACFVCGSYNHLIKDYDFHEKRMAKKSGRVPVSVAKQSSFRAAASTGAVKQVNTATHTNRVNVSKLRTNAFHMSNSPIRMSFYKSTTPNTRISNEKVNTNRVNGVNTAGQTSAVKGNEVTVVKASTGYVWRPKMTDLNNVSKDNSGSWVSKRGNPQQALKNKGIFDIGCSRHMTGNKDFLTDYQDIDGGFVAFGGSARGELKFNLFSVSQMCDKKNNVLFTKTECLVLSPDFKLLDESQVLLRVPRQSNMLGHVNFKTMNKLVKGNLVRGLPSKIFENDHTCVACQKGKQHKASCKAKLVSSISQPLQMLHMDLFGPTSVRSINHKTYCLVVTDDFSRFSWVFFLASKDETSGILKRFITEIENQLNHKVKVIRYPMETNKALTKDEDGEDVDIHLYRSMIGSLMYLTSSIPDIIVMKHQNHEMLQTWCCTLNILTVAPQVVFRCVVMILGVFQIQNGNSKKRISTVKDGVIRILPPVTVAEIQVVEKEMKAKNILLMAIPKEHMRRFHGMNDAKEI
ncbi:putative ribonuclease H-like domain-containing protein [Tanacetum coccineum]